MTGLSDIGAEAVERAQERAEQRDSESDYQNEYERYDVSGDAFVKQHVPTAVRGTVELIRTFPEYDEDEERYTGDAYFGIKLSDPSVYTGEETFSGTTIVQSNRDKGDDYKVVNEDDEATEILDGTGVDFDSNLFYGEQVDAFEDDEILLKASGSAGRSIIQCLDVHGHGGAYPLRDDDGELVLHGGGFPQHNGALIEYHPDDEPPYRRYARDAELRPDVEGTEVIVMLQRTRDIREDYDGDSYWATVLAETDEDPQVEVDGVGFSELEPTDEFEPSEDLLAATGFIEWNRAPLEELNERRVEEGFDRYEPDE